MAWLHILLAANGPQALPVLDALPLLFPDFGLTRTGVTILYG